MDPQINKAVNDVKTAKSTAALGAEFAPEYIKIKDVKLWYKTVSHAWVLPAVIENPKITSDFEKGMLTFYILAHDPESVRNKIMQELKEGTITDKALDFMITNQLVPEDFEGIGANELLRNPYTKN